MAYKHRTKIDARLRRYAELGCVAADSDPTGRTCWIDPGSGHSRSTPPDPASRRSRKDRYADVFIEVTNADAIDWVRRHPGVKRKSFVQVVDGYCSARVSLDHLGVLADHAGVTEIEPVHFFEPQLDRSVDSIRGWAGQPRNGREGQNEGSGVVVGIVDYGLDFTLEDFQQPRGKTRIAFLWDQELQPQGRERTPRKYRYGVEYDRAQIDRALRARDPFRGVRHQPADPMSDVAGHGTHVAGIAAGNGKTRGRDFPTGTFVGVAPGATIVFVNLDREAILHQVRSGRGTLANSIHLAHAIAYCFEKADELGMPCVVNLSMGFNGGGHDGNMVIEWIIDALLQKHGRAVVGVAGNQNRPTRNVYLRGSVRLGERSTLVWQNGLILPNRGGVVALRDPSANEMEIWYSGKSSLRARLIAPQQDEASRWVKPDERPIPYDFAGGESVIITSDQKTPWNGVARIHIHLSSRDAEKGIRAGKWLVELEPVQVATEERNGVRWDAWIERTIPEDTSPLHARSRFPDYEPSTAITLTTPSTGRSVIAVASCNSNDPPQVSDISEFSGRGPTRDGRPKPDVAAPGEAIMSSNAGGSRGAPARVQKSGTSMAAPHVTGVVARLLSRHRYLNWREILDILQQTAMVPQDIATPHPLWGHGKVDAAAAVRNLEAKVH